jgi:hypothetical protein
MGFNVSDRAARTSGPPIFPFAVRNQVVCPDDADRSLESAFLGEMAVCMAPNREWARPLHHKLFAVAAHFGPARMR